MNKKSQSLLDFINFLPLQSVVQRAPLSNKEAHALFTIWKSNRDKYGKPIVPDNMDPTLVTNLTTKGMISNNASRYALSASPVRTVDFTKKGREIVKSLILDNEASAFEKNSSEELDYQKVYSKLQAPIVGKGAEKTASKKLIKRILGRNWLERIAYKVAYDEQVFRQWQEDEARAKQKRDELLRQRAYEGTFEGPSDQEQQSLFFQSKSPEVTPQVANPPSDEVETEVYRQLARNINSLRGQLGGDRERQEYYIKDFLKIWLRENNLSLRRAMETKITEDFIRQMISIMTSGSTVASDDIMYGLLGALRRKPVDDVPLDHFKV